MSETLDFDPDALRERYRAERDRQEGGDSAATYFERTECVAGVQDARFQQLMPDVLHWLGVKKIDRLMSMSNRPYRLVLMPVVIPRVLSVVYRKPMPGLPARWRKPKLRDRSCATSAPSSR